MLSISGSGKNINDIAKLLDENSNEEEFKILIDSPEQADEIKKLLESHGFSDVLPEDDDGLLFLIASRKIQDNQENFTTTFTTTESTHKISNQQVSPNTIAILISSSKNKSSFINHFIKSLTLTQNKNSSINVLALIDNAVKFAAYDSISCEYIKKLESNGTKILISDSCADRLGITEALGTGLLTPLNDILDEIFICEKLITL